MPNDEVSLHSKGLGFRGYGAFDFIVQYEEVRFMLTYEGLCFYLNNIFNHRLYQFKLRKQITYRYPPAYITIFKIKFYISQR